MSAIETVKDCGFEWHVTEGWNYTPEMVNSAIVHAAVTGSVGATESMSDVEDPERIVSSVTVKRGDRLSA